MMDVPLVTSDTIISDEQFRHSVVLYHNRPHLVNRRLIGTIQVLFFRINSSIDRLRNCFTRSAILYEVRKLKEISKETIHTEFLRNILQPYDKNVKFEEADVENLLKKEDESLYVSVRILLSRHGVDNCIEVVIFDMKLRTCIFYGASEFDQKILVPPFPYDIQLSSGYLTIRLQSIEDAENPSAEWLVDQLFFKLMKWANSYDPKIEVKSSLSLVSIEDYSSIYQRLKEIYGRKIVNAWPEKTDPLKFVYEDVAIASYLISLWKVTDPDRKPSFVDLGCGNGLLVYILNQEGYMGQGIDVRKRKIWDWYQNTTLKVETINPSVDYVFPNADWIIGNHSDELTPWIPVITARSSYKSNFFLLPCCAYEFSGEKYKRKNTSISTYSDYLNYVGELCEMCGFKFEIDKLRIPSTKRTCIVSLGRRYQEIEFMSYSEQIKNNVKGQLNNAIINTRSAVEKVRNCTQLNKGFLTKIIIEIALVLMKAKDMIEKADGGWWNKGIAMTLSTLAGGLSRGDLRNLKNECGGLQTLLKNHRYIFELNRDFVRLRLPLTASETKLKYKDKLCWFHRNHPDGCLHNEDVCAYLH
ncbi:hypothetical protein FQR65_LT11683 [Abscondita terminalis]|nr:hypothetical protein FQR65_LT11683 [Abscondita terminalis]